jgi:two-component system NtrC family response regulator
MANEVILIIDDEPVQRDAIAGYLRKQGYRALVAGDGSEGLAAVRREPVDAVLTDYRMPGMSGFDLLKEIQALNPEVAVVLMTAYGSVRGAVEAMQSGAFDYLAKPIDLDDLDLVLKRAIERRSLLSENRELKRQIEGRGRLEGIISVSPAMEEALNVAARTAGSRATVLLRGESGTGKEVVARAIHAASPRRDREFVAVNCAALNANLIESELFGHEKGAFTGADRQRRGRFEQADGGTLFVDEVAEIPAETQAKLLRAIQERAFERVGGSETIKVDVRIIAATNRDLEAMITDGRFREDLFYRLNVVSITLPALRNRRADIPPLVEDFVDRYAKENGKPIAGVSREAMDLLMKHSYPGNVRELENLIERAVVMARGNLLTTDDLPVPLRNAAPSPARTTPSAALPDRIEAMEREAISEALRVADGNQSRAAASLGITERNLRYKMKKYNMKG